MSLMGELSSAGALLCAVAVLGSPGAWRVAPGVVAAAEWPGPRRYSSSSLSQVRSEMT